MNSSAPSAISGRGRPSPSSWPDRSRRRSESPSPLCRDPASRATGRCDPPPLALSAPPVDVVELVRMADRAARTAAAETHLMERHIQCGRPPVVDLAVETSALGDDPPTMMAAQGTGHRTSSEDRPHRLSGGLRAVGRSVSSPLGLMDQRSHLLAHANDVRLVVGPDNECTDRFPRSGAWHPTMVTPAWRPGLVPGRRIFARARPARRRG